MAKTPPKIPAQKPRNFVAKNAIGSGAGAHKDKKKAFKQGEQKHKNKEYAESLAFELEKQLEEGKFDDKFGGKFNDILQKQYQPVTPPKAPTRDTDFEGWTIRTRSGPGKVSWAVLDRRGDKIQQQGSEISMDAALMAAKRWIKSGGGQSKINASSVTIDFNAAFAKEFAPEGETFFSTIDYGDDTPVLYVSLMPQKGLKRSSIRTQKDKITNGTTKLPAITLSGKEAKEAKLVANGRYVLGSQDKISNDTYQFPLIYQSTVLDKGDRMRFNQPGLTVAVNREVAESEISELSNNKLSQYKKAASADASAADKRGDFEKGHKRFKGIVKATNKQFANDKKSVAEANGDKVEAYGYQYNNRDQRVVWRKTFSNEAAAYVWADKRNATVIGVRPMETTTSRTASNNRINESEGDKEGLPHLTSELAKHILEQIETEGVHAIVKSIEWGDGAADELVELFKTALQEIAAKKVSENFENYMESLTSSKKPKKRFTDLEIAIMEGGGNIGPEPLRKKKVNESYEEYLNSVLKEQL